jgi:dephospho-CoA kinase
VQRTARRSPAVADLVFPDPEALADLNAIVHPAVGGEIAARPPSPTRTTSSRRRCWSNRGKTTCFGTIVVDCDPEVPGPLVSTGLPADARAHRPAGRTHERLARADFVVHNDGSRDELPPQIEACWAWITSVVAAASGDPAAPA